MAISILTNVGNAAFALPMVQAYPTDPNVQQLLGWDPANQALAYIPYTGNALGDFGVARDLSVIRDAAIGRNTTIAGTLGVTGATALGGAVSVNGVLTTLLANPAVIPAIANSLRVDGVSPLLNLNGATGQLQVNGTKVVAARDTGWAAMTGTPQKTTAATGTVTLPQLAGIVMALQTALIAHGLIGP